MLALQDAATKVDDELANQTYRAWIMAMVGQRKMLKWSKEDMVNNANLFAREVLGRSGSTSEKSSTVNHNRALAVITEH